MVYNMSNSTILLDFGKNRKTVRNKRVFSNSLEDQLKNLPLGDDYDYEDFVRDEFIKNDCRVFVSYPNFKREPSQLERGVYYNNFALRFPEMIDDGRDMVLMCDVFEKNQDPDHPERPIDRKFEVKSILLMDSNIIHYGEIDSVCNIIVNLGEDKDSIMWEAEDWEGKWPTTDHLRSNLLSNDFLLELNKKYVVKSPDKVKDELNKWRSYIESREYLIEAESKNGYVLERIPEFIKAFSTGGDPKIADYGEIKYLDPKCKGWTLEKVNAESREALLLHISVDELDKDYINSKGTRDNLKSKLDRFTRDPIVLSYGGGEKKVGKQGQNELRISDRRLSVSTVETIEPIDVIENIRLGRDMNIKTAKKEIESEFEKTVRTKLQTFQNSKLRTLIEQFASEQRIPITKRISAEFEGKKGEALDRLTKERDMNQKRAQEIREKIEILHKNPSGGGGGRQDEG